MKKKLKVLKQELATAKAAWSAAKKAKKADAEVKALHEAYQKLQLVIDEAEAADAKDEDDIEIQAPPAASPAGETITGDELKTLLAETLGAEIKKHLPAEKQAQVTNESIQAIVEAAIAKHSKDGGKTVPAVDVKAIATAAITEQLAQIKNPSKQRHDTDPASHEGKSTVTIELPFAHTKGNLPVHMKQLLNVMLKQPMNHEISAEQLARAKDLGNRMIAKYVGMAKRGEKALTSTGAGTGDEFVPTELSAELQRRLFLASDLAALMAGREIEMPTQPFELPLNTTRPTFFLETTENVAATESTPGTAKLVLDAKKLMGRVDFSYEVDEDSIIPILPFVQEQLSEAAADVYESVLINGDTTATHQDSDTQAIAKAGERAFMGFRKLARSVTTLSVDLSTGGISEANLRTMRKRMGKWGVRVRDLLWIVGPNGINDIMAIANVATLEKYGPRATILTGELASFLNIPIITSERNREDLTSLAIFDGVTTTKGSILLVNTRMWIPGRRRDFTVEVDRDIKTQTQFIVGSFRRAFIPVETPSATIKHVVIGRNYDA